MNDEGAKKVGFTPGLKPPYFAREVFAITPQLRFRRAAGGSILEQAWQGNHGTVRWEAVPVVDGDEA